jgi:hypothetical protein
MASSSGGVYTLGDANFYGAVSSPPYPIVGIAATPDTQGYWLVSNNGTVYARGDAYNYGSASGVTIVAIASTADGGGYWLVASTGQREPGVAHSRHGRDPRRWRLLVGRSRRRGVHLW